MEYRTDAELLGRVERDAAAFGVFYRRHVDRDLVVPRAA